MAVGAPFAVLVAEQLSASGVELIISITSAGQVRPVTDPPYFVLIGKALRDEGTSLHYQPPAAWSRLRGHLKPPLIRALRGLPEPVLVGASWTTDAPYRETRDSIEAASEADVLCVEMEAAALYAYAAARNPRRRLPRPHHQHDGDGRRGLRKGRRQRCQSGSRDRQGRCFCPHLAPTNTRPGDAVSAQIRRI